MVLAGVQIARVEVEETVLDHVVAHDDGRIAGGERRRQSACVDTRRRVDMHPQPVERIGRRVWDELRPDAGPAGQPANATDRTPALPRNDARAGLSW